MGLNRLQTVIVQRVVEDVIQGFSVFLWRRWATLPEKKTSTNYIILS